MAVLQVICCRSIVVEIIQVVEGIQGVVVTRGVRGWSVGDGGRQRTWRDIVEFADVEIADFTGLFATF